MDADNVSPGLQLRIMDGQTYVAGMSIGGDFDINITRDASLLEAKLRSLENTIILHIVSNQYSTRIKDDGQTTSLSVYYQDPFATKYSLDAFHNNDISGIESTMREE